LPPYVTYCPFCGTKAEIEPFRRPKLLTIAGLTATTAACVSIIGGLLSLMTAYYLLLFYAATGQYDFGMFLLFVTLGLINFTGFVLGSTAGIYSWRKRSFRSAVVAIALLPFVGLLNLMVLNAPHEGAYGAGSFLAWIIGVPIIIFSLLSLIFTVIKQQEFK